MANAILSKFRRVVNRKTLKIMYHAIFEPNLHCSSLAWAQNSNSVKKTFCFTKKNITADVFSWSLILSYVTYPFVPPNNIKLYGRNFASIGALFTWNKESHWL